MTRAGHHDHAALPVRDLVDVRLADLLARPGCPVCRARADTEARFLDSWLYERVQDVRTRRQLDETRGLCENHIHAMLVADRARAGGGLGTAILYEAMLRVRLAELDAVHDARGRGRGRSRSLAAADAPPACLVCRETLAAEAGTLDGLSARIVQPAWSDALGGAALCLGHLRALMRRGSGDDRWRTIEARQLERLAALRERLRLFAHHASHDRRHLRTVDQESSVDEAAAALGGDRSVGSRGS